MFGRFLEVSLNTDDIAASVQFYERLGFTQLTTGDTWPHPYGVLTDGRLCIGLHQRRGPAPLLSFVRPELAQHMPGLRAAGFEPHSARLGESDFHELQLRDPAGQDIALLEARTYSPARGAQPGSLCGWFSSYSMPAADPDATQAYWERAGFVALELPDEPLLQLALTSDTLTLTLHPPRLLPDPLLVFSDARMPERIARIAAGDIDTGGMLPRGLDPRANALIDSPEGVRLLLLQGEG